MYNHVVKVGSTVYIAGQVSRDLDGKTAYVGDVEGQVRQVWANLEKAVIAVGGSLRDIPPLTWLVPRIWGRFAVPDWPYYRTTLVVVGLADPDLLVEVEAIAVIGE